ncbi:MAG TPA: hypothetical protein VGD10_00335 [Allosphingosinicella sp.]|uniref:hypothetical protein n=1 Tax=Allosphingosinicella sp. TaxID=2823234 RepID=UPI002ED8328F
MRIAGGIIAGVVAAFLCIILVELAGRSIFPPPPGLDPMNPADQPQIMAQLPAAAFATVALAWGIGAFAGAWIATRIARRLAAGWVVTLLILAACIANLVMIPHPTWMWAAGTVLPLVGGWLGSRFGINAEASAAAVDNRG